MTVERYIISTFPRVFYGWVIVIAVFVISGTAAGLMYSFAAFIQGIEASFNTSRSQVSAIFAGAEFVWFISGFLGGFLADKYGPARIVFVGSILMSGGFYIASIATNMETLIFAYALGVGTGGGLIYIPSISIVQRWFKRQRGKASGIAICGVGAGSLLFPIIAERIGEIHGWADVQLFFSVIVVILCGGLSFLLIASPDMIGRNPDGDICEGSSLQSSSGKLIVEALKTPIFWRIYIASLFTSSTIFTTYVHLVPYSTDNGNGSSMSIALIGALSISSIAGRYLFGGLSDRLGSRKTMGIMFFGMALAMAWWWLAPPTVLVLFIYTIFFGAFYGGSSSILPVLTMSYFGGREISTIIGALYTSWAGGALLGPILVGYIRDITGTYDTGLVISFIFLILAAVIIMSSKDSNENY